MNKIYNKRYKRIFDFFLSFVILLPITLFLIPFLFLVWLQDFKNPLYISNRVGHYKKKFPLIKVRSMIFDKNKNNVFSTAKDDKRITKIGKLIRKLKIDELSQIYNVLIGHMSFVGPRPNTFECGVEFYTTRELNLLNVRPGITDISSIVFSDEAEILSNSKDPDNDYNILIRPWKSRLGLLYIDNCSLKLDLCLIIITMIAILNKKFSLKLLVMLVKKLDSSEDLIETIHRKHEIKIIKPPI